MTRDEIFADAVLNMHRIWNLLGTEPTSIPPITTNTELLAVAGVLAVMSNMVEVERLPTDAWDGGCRWFESLAEHIKAGITG